MGGAGGGAGIAFLVFGGLFCIARAGPYFRELERKSEEEVRGMLSLRYGKHSLLREKRKTIR